MPVSPTSEHLAGPAGVDWRWLIVGLWYRPIDYPLTELNDAATMGFS